ncbi:MAG: FAD-dependent oxidoreductase [Kiritimatiellia bacterium]
MKSRKENFTGNKLNRRGFFRSVTGAAGALSLTTAGCATGSQRKATAAPGHYRENARDIPLHTGDDVIVCGAGPAGVSAAIAAARTGAVTRLIDVNGCLGGVWTAGLLAWIFDFDKPGLTKEIIRRLDARNARREERFNRFTYEPEEMKVLLEEMCEEAGVHVRLHTRVTAAYKKGRRLETVVTESKSGREAWQAQQFIDATGDGDLGALSGCGWDLGNPETETCQPLTLNVLAAVKDINLLKPYISGGDLSGHVESTKLIKNEIKRAGFNPSYGMPTIFHIRDNIVLLMFNHEYGVRPDDADAMTAATLHARKEVFSIMRGLRKLGGPWQKLQLVSSAEHIGIRDGRRIHGLYTVTKKDLENGRRHADSVARVTFGVDIHAFTHEKNEIETIGRGGIKQFHPYDIPLRALIARDVDGLMTAGRCISGDFVAHASYRVTGNSVATGEATGTVAALAADRKTLPQNIAWKDAAKRIAQDS